MLFFKRLATSLFLFVILFLVLFLGTLGIGGGVAGYQATAHRDVPAGFNDGYEIGYQAGANFRKRFLPAIFLGSFGISAAAALALSFSGILPWCRKGAEPPVLR